MALDGLPTVSSAHECSWPSSPACDLSTALQERSGRTQNVLRRPRERVPALSSRSPPRTSARTASVANLMTRLKPRQGLPLQSRRCSQRHLHLDAHARTDADRTARSGAPHPESDPPSTGRDGPRGRSGRLHAALPLQSRPRPASPGPNTMSESATNTVPEPTAPVPRESSVKRFLPIQADPELLDARALARRWSTSVRTIRRLIAGGSAPRPVRISRRVIRWRLSEVRRWEAALEKAFSTRRAAD